MDVASWLRTTPEGPPYCKIFERDDRWLVRKERTMEFNRIKIEPLSANIGAEVQGVDLTKLDDTTFDQIQEAFLRHQVLFFRDQELTREQHLSSGRRFGETPYSSGRSLARRLSRNNADLRGRGFDR